jgi:hypothetical protein
MSSEQPRTRFFDAAKLQPEIPLPKNHRTPRLQHHLHRALAPGQAHLNSHRRLDLRIVRISHVFFNEAALNSGFLITANNVTPSAAAKRHTRRQGTGEPSSALTMLRRRKEISFTSAIPACYYVGYGRGCPTQPVLCWHVAASGRTHPPLGGRQQGCGTGLRRYFAGEPCLWPVARHVDQGR